MRKKKKDKKEYEKSILSGDNLCSHAIFET